MPTFAAPVAELASLHIGGGDEDTDKIVVNDTPTTDQAKIALSRFIPDGYVKYPLDPRGDAWVRMDVGEETKLRLNGLWTEESSTWAFRVCSRTLARCSPVFASHLFPENNNVHGGPTQSSPRVPREAVLQFHQREDNCVGMALLLCIMHDQSTQNFLPVNNKTGDLDQAERKKIRIFHLHKSLEMAIKYECNETMRTKFLVLSRDLKGVSQPIKDCEDFHRVAWMAGTLGGTTLLKHCVWGILRHFSATEDSTRTEDDEMFAERLEFQDLMSRKRIAIINQLVDIIHSYPVLKAIRNPADYEKLCSSSSVAACPEHHERQACGAYLVGQAALVLNNNGLWPLPGEDCMDISVNMLLEITWALREMNEGKGLPVLSPSGEYVHERCGVCDVTGLDAKMGTVVDKIWLETVDEAKGIFSDKMRQEGKVLAWD